ILDKIGEGGMGVVYKAHDTKLDRTVALKFLPSHFTDSEKSKERLIREAKTAATLNHPNICTIYSIDEYEGQHFISMEYIDGTTMREKLKSGGLSLYTVLSYAKGIASALSAAHDKGIVHRDIKPENIMVDTEDRVKVTDFGLARINGTRNLTKEGRIVGTMAYMSPEQIQQGEADERSDLFSFGIVLYEMLTGIHPFEGEYEQATGFKLVNENPDPPSTIRAGIPPGIEDIVLRCLEKDRDKRYRSARDLTVELEGESSWPLNIAADTSIYGRGLIPAVSRIKQKPWFWIVAGILVLAFGGWMYTLDAGTDLPEEKHIAVLPFTNLSVETIPASMGDGMMEIVTSKITRMETRQGSLWVVPSSEIRGQQVSSISDAIRLFGVNMAVTATLQLVGDRFRMTINLVDGTTLRQIRSEVIEREWGGTDFAQLQDDVVATLMTMLELELGPDDVQNILAGSSQDPR
ncbi:MAG: serine/threonine-protein kinase, partial [Candidatus Paceibacterota bacterium]